MEASTAMPGRLSMGRPLRLSGDDRLTAAAQNGDDRAFEAIFDRYHRPLLSFCRHMLGSLDEAEDAVQQTFVAAHRALTSQAKRILLRPWLYTIARNQCVSMLRARRQTVALDDVEPATDGLAQEVQQREDLRNMLADVQVLPDDQRAALLLAELGALSHEQIAGVVGCPTAKVKALIFQARTSLAATREARDTSCTDIRRQLATLRGSSLRRANLRRHVRQCAGCQQFESDMRRQRAAMAILLPVLPTAGFKEAALGAAGSKAAVGASAGAGSGLVIAGVGVQKVAAIGAAVIAVGGGAAAIEDGALGRAVLDVTAPASSAQKQLAQAGEAGLLGAVSSFPGEGIGGYVPGVERLDGSSAGDPQPGPQAQASADDPDQGSDDGDGGRDDSPSERLKREQAKENAEAAASEKPEEGSDSANAEQSTTEPEPPPPTGTEDHPPTEPKPDPANDRTGSVQVGNAKLPVPVPVEVETPDVEVPEIEIPDVVGRLPGVDLGLGGRDGEDSDKSSDPKKKRKDKNGDK